MNAFNAASKRSAELGRVVAVAGRILYRDGVSGLFSKIAHWRQYRAAQPKIDAEHGTDTLSWVAVSDLRASGPNVSYATDYGPSPAFDFDLILRKVPITYSEYAF